MRAPPVCSCVAFFMGFLMMDRTEKEGQAQYVSTALTAGVPACSGRQPRSRARRPASLLAPC